MRHGLRILVLALTLSGCATFAWEKPGVPPEVAARDDADCRALAASVAQEAWFATFAWAPPPHRYWGYPWGYPAWGYPGWAYHPGLRPWGGPIWPPYYGAWGPDPGWVLHTEQRVYDRCMMQKGYRLVEQPRNR